MLRPKSAKNNIRQSPTVTARFFAVILALVMTIAPSWHICMLGGHCAEGPTVGGHGANHTAAAAPLNKDGVRQALICWCPPEKSEGERPLKQIDFSKLPQAGQDLTSEASNFCLALLLQGMPGALVATPPLQVPTQLQTSEYRSTRYLALYRVRHSRLARGPPTLSL